jgi:hypothetical protein
LICLKMLASAVIRLMARLTARRAPRSQSPGGGSACGALSPTNAAAASSTACRVR